ncbi:unnamed protein product, partial [Rotaria sordida]
TNFVSNFLLGQHKHDLLNQQTTNPTPDAYDYDRHNSNLYSRLLNRVSSRRRYSDSDSDYLDPNDTDYLRRSNFDRDGNRKGE